MKKFATLTLALMLTFSLTAAFAQTTYTAGQYYTIDYNDELTLDNTSYTSENTADNLWLFMLYNDDYLIDAALSAASGYEGVSLYDADQSVRDAYKDDTLEAFADENIAFVDEVTTVSGFPFYIFSMDGSDGAYYYAETIANGSSVNFCCYYNDATATLDDALLQNFETMLITLRPAEDTGTDVTAASAKNDTYADATSAATKN